MQNSLKTNIISLSNLSGFGFVLSPNPVIAFTSNPNASIPGREVQPCVIAAIPNPEEFAAGLDIVGNGLIVKPKGQRDAYVPFELRPFLPVIQMALDCDVLTLGTAGARDRWLLVRASRHTCDNPDLPHQSHVAGWHDHASQGPSTFYLASDRFGTELRDWTTPDASVIRLDRTHEHRSPVIGNNRRTFFVVASYADDPDPRSEKDLHRHPMTQGLSGMTRARKSGVIESWHTAATAALREQYPRQHYEKDLRRWLRGQLALSP